MNRGDVGKLLNEYMGDLKRNVDSVEEFLKEFEIWNCAIQEHIKLRRKGENSDVPNVPPTPGATLRVRRILSPIVESLGDEGQRDSRTPRIKKNTGSPSSKRLKRNQLSVEEEKGEIINNAPGNTTQDSANVCIVNVQIPSLRSVQENVGEERREGKRGRRTKRSYSKKLTLPVRRNTRSNARITQSITCEVINDQDGNSLNEIIQASTCKPTQENDVNENSYQRGRRTKQNSIVRKMHMVTSTRISRSNAQIARSVDYETSSDERNPHSAVACNKEIVHENNVEERRVSINGSERHCGRRTRNTSREIADDMSQDSLNVPHMTSRSSVSRSLEEKGLRMEEATTTIKANSNENTTKSPHSNHKALNDDVQASLNISTITETVATVAAQDNSNVVRFKQLSSNTKCYKTSKSLNGVKELSVCLTRLNDSLVNTFTLPLREEYRKSGAIQSGKERANSEGSKRKSLNTATTSEALKRSISFVDHRSSKRSRYDTNAKEIEIEQALENIKETNKKPENSGRCKSGRRTSRLSETKNKNQQAFIEVNSFSGISVSSTLDEKNQLFGELCDKHDNSQSNDKPDSQKSSNCGLEHSEYYSLVDTGENVQDDKDACPAPQINSVSNGKVKPKPALGTKQEETLHVIREQNSPTPERTVSRKGGKSPALFSPYANEPVKNRVAAYEGLSTVTEELQVPTTNKRVTRTKTRAMAAAAAAAAAAGGAAHITGPTQPKFQVNNSHRKSGPSLKVSRASWRIKKKIANSAKKNNASKENSFQHNLSKNTDRYYKNISGTGSKILADVNGLFSPALNNSKKTPMTGPRIIAVNNLSSSQISRSGYRPGVILSSGDTFIKKPVMKAVQDSEIKKLEERKKREEKEREALRRREELLKKQAEEKKKKNDELRLRAQEKREAQEKEKQESQLRVGKEKDEKRLILQQEREAKQKGNALKKKLESERKAAEARRKLEEAEAARIAKLKMEELQQRKEQEEAEKERLRRIAEEKEIAMLREREEQNAKVLALMAKAKAENQKNPVQVHKPPVKAGKVLDATFTKPLDSTFTVKSGAASKTSKNLDNAYNLEDIESEDSGEEDSMPKQTARWAGKSAMLPMSRRELSICRYACEVFSAPDFNISAIFPKKTFKRTSSAIWNTPPRYSVLPKY